NATFQGASVRYPSNAPLLPAGVLDQISAISGLSEGFDRFTLPLTGVGPLERPGAGARPGGTTNAITPSALHLAYGLNDLYNFSGRTHWASGEAIAILLWGDGFDPSDINTFYNQYYPAGFPTININWYPIHQAPDPGPGALNDPSNAPQELTLDLEYSGSAAPGATLDAVYAPDGPASRGYSPVDADMESALTTAADLANVRAISMSFGTPDRSDPSFQASFETAFAVATQRGITLLGASGDNGGQPLSGNCPVGGPAPQYPAASPQVLAVGGTSPELSQSVLGTITGLASETAWNGSGGGYSTTYGAPSWQTASGASPVISPQGHRGIPDVAGPSTYNRFFYGGQAMAGNGTSFATPFWAGMITEMDALLPQPLGFVTPRLYSVASAEVNGTKALGLVPVTGESGPTCNAATGWGSPRAGLLYEDLIGTFVDVTLHNVPPEVAPAGNLGLTVEVLNATSMRPIDALPVHVALEATPGYLGPCGGSLDSQTVTTDAQGNVTVGLPVSGCYLGSAIVISVTVLADGYFGNVSTTVRVNLLGLAGFLAIVQVYPYNVVAFALIMIGAIGLGVLLGRVRRRRAARRAISQGGRTGTPTLGRVPVATPPPPSATGPPTPAPSSEGPPPGAMRPQDPPTPTLPTAGPQDIVPAVPSGVPSSPPPDPEVPGPGDS
ncbi:MAG: S53 family peptidase, partial [Thermoplasmata archaeon]|nr:S53 family peptidase [Thermoplasmata archaeon]